MSDQPQPLPLPPSRHHIRHVVRRTLSKSWDDSIFSESAQAAFWCALSLPPLLLGMLGSLAYIAPLFGPETLLRGGHETLRFVLASADTQQKLSPATGPAFARSEAILSAKDA